MLQKQKDNIMPGNRYWNFVYKYSHGIRNLVFTIIEFISL